MSEVIKISTLVEYCEMDLAKPNALDAIGCYAICSNGVRAKITGISKMPWGLSFVGFTDSGIAWTSCSPKVEFNEGKN